MSSSPTLSSSTEAEVSKPAPPAPFPFASLGDVTCRLTAQLGTGSLTVRQCLSLARHTVVRLREGAGEDLLVLVNGVPVGRAEVAIIDNTTALRLTEILAPGELS
jgi:flagellar motor switch/type III secretory pathway protein FliN